MAQLPRLWVSVSGYGSAPETLGQRKQIQLSSRRILLAQRRRPEEAPHLLGGQEPEDGGDDRHADRARGSVPRITFVTSPRRLTTRIPTASRYPHGRPRQSPREASAQATLTVSIRTTTQVPMPPKASRARGLSRHMGSRKLPGKSSATAHVRLMTVPAAKKILRAVMPLGRIFDGMEVGLHKSTTHTLPC